MLDNAIHPADKSLYSVDSVVYFSKLTLFHWIVLTREDRNQYAMDTVIRSMFDRAKMPKT